MKSSLSSSSGKSEARSPFQRSPAPETPGEGRLKRKLDFDVEMLLTVPLVNVGGSKPSKRKTLFHLRDESITQPLDGSKKKIEVVDLVGQSDGRRDSGAESHNPSKFRFPTHVLPPPPAIGSIWPADIPGPSSCKPAADLISAMQLRIEKLEAEVGRLCRIMKAIPGCVLGNSPASKCPSPATSPHPDAFDVWFSSADAPNALMKVAVPTLANEGVSREWFRPILDKCELMTDQHMDAILNLFVMQRKTRSGLWLERWTIMDMVCWQALSQPDYELVGELVLPYVRGDCPSGLGISWAYFESVYGVAVVHEKHFVLYEVRLHEQKIVVYDPNSHKLRFNDYRPLFDIMSHHIPKLLAAADIELMIDGQPLPRCSKFDVARLYNTPQQKSEQECAMMVLEFLTCLINQMELSTVEPGLFDGQRLSYCDELYNYGLKRLRGEDPDCFDN